MESGLAGGLRMERPYVWDSRVLGSTGHRELADKMAHGLVLGTAIGLTVAQVKPFLRSLRNSGYRGDAVLLVDRTLRRQLRDDAVASEVRLLWAPSLLPVNFGRMRRNRLWRILWAAVHTALWMLPRLIDRCFGSTTTSSRYKVVLARLVCTPMEARFLRYRQILHDQPHDRVLLSDVRDVIFQHDPFHDVPAQGLAVSIETHRYTIATEPHNSAWVEQTYGPDMLGRIGASQVSCVGVTYGDQHSMSAYLDLMTREILRLSPGAARRGGADTAIHNVLVWTNQLGVVHELETLSSPVATLNGILEEDVTLSPDGRLLNRDGSEPSVVHQYDRLPRVASTLLRVLAGEQRPGAR